MDKAFQPAFLLHHRPFRDSSVIAEFFTPEWGRVPAVAKAVRGGSARMRQMAASLQPFQELQISLRGKGELKTLVSVESARPYTLQGHNLYAALYLNELTLRLLHRLDPHPDLWHLYRECLQHLSQAPVLEPVLRCYELGLLDQLGYGLVFDTDAASGESVTEDGEYLFAAERGFVRQFGLPAHPGELRYSGKTLLVVANRIAAGAVMSGEAWLPAELRILKQVCRQALAPLLGSQPLRSRELFTGKAL
ncbi:MAG TPA: DNA repair protein RecO [Spongiibacteraceae bacterium]|nr:DNA repair protein RecO [Spongiibacteraceae bacterium]HCS25981.1 DNA repair protein RecO [Spongiibacteraceae bacterium]|tara:strand:+ start:2400 stop:3146 length:747 start_codon:yes stop_codon:yes gene_type:complete